MLTKDDLKQIRGIVQDETRKIIKEEVDPIKGDLGVLKADVGVLKTDVGVLKKDVHVLKVDMKSVKKDVVKIRRDMSTITNFFDTEYLELRQRVEKIEDHLGITYAA